MTARTIICWNVQRLFGSAGSPIEQALSEDDATASETAVEKKLDVIAAVIDAIGERAGPPLLVGLVEIENDELARAIGDRVRSADLTSVDDLGRDRAGVALDGLNVTLLVDRGTVTGVTGLASHVIDRTFNTRDVLECDLALRQAPELSVLVNHWPSRLSSEGAGRRLSAAHYVNRLVAARTRYSLREMWDPERAILDLPNSDEMRERSRHPVVVMGDFNDEPFSPSIELLGASNDAEAVRDDLYVKGRTKKSRLRTYSSSTPRLFNPWWEAVGRYGSYYRSPRWRIYDQIMFTSGMLQRRAPIRTIEDSAAIFDDDEVTLPDGTTWTLVNRGHKPIAFDLDKSRGCSDHFCVYTQVELADP